MGHEAMQRSTADRKAAAACRESSICGQRATHKPDATERLRVGQGHVNPKPLQYCPSVREQAFTAGLVDRWLRTVRHQHLQPLFASRNRGSQSCGATANHENVSRFWHALIHADYH